MYLKALFRRNSRNPDLVGKADMQIIKILYKNNKELESFESSGRWYIANSCWGVEENFMEENT